MTSEKKQPKARPAVSSPLRRSRGTGLGGASRAFGVHVEADVTTLVRKLGGMIDAARKQVSVTANATLTALYWQIGHHVRTEVLEGRRAAYGAQIVAAVSRQLEVRHGRGFGEKNLRRMVQFATAFPTGRLSPRCGDN